MGPPAPTLAPACALHPDVPAEQACPRCGTFACRACLRAAPGGATVCASCEARGAAVELPWDDRARHGTITAFARTCWAILLHPGQVLDHARAEGGVGSSLAFASLAGLTTYLTTLLLYGIAAAGVLAALLLGAKAGERKPPTGVTLGLFAAAVAILLVTFVATTLGSTLLSAALDHLVLKLVGANPRPFAVTLRASALSQAPCLIGLIPFCGISVAPIWAAVIRVFAYRGLHRISTGKAALGALLVPGVLAAVVVTSYAVLIAMAMSGRKF